MPPLTARSPLIVDATPDLQRVDSVVTRIIRERSTWDAFLQDPNGTLIATGLHPPTTPEINARVNETFYAVLSNKPLLELLAQSVKRRPPAKAKAARFAKTYAAGLQRGEIRHEVAQDIDALSSIVADRATFRRALLLTLEDLNRRGLLQRKYPKRTIDDYLNQIVAVATTGKSLRAVPALESWDRNYGIGKSFGGLWIEVGPFVTGVAFVEILTAVTVGIDHDLHPTAPNLAAMTAGARRGDRKQVEALAIYGKLLAFGGELMAHVANFESMR
jgi:hypothetical protein